MNKRKYLGLLIFTLVFTLMICGAATANAADVPLNNPTDGSVNQATAQPTKTNTNLKSDHATSNSNTSKSKDTSNSSESKKNQTLPDPIVYRNGVPVSTSFYTIQDAINFAQNGDTIMLEPTTFSGTGNTEIFISKNLNFDVLYGGTATIDGGGTRWGFYISSGYTVTFNHIIFQSTKGAAIINYGTLDVTDSTFTNNTATGNGGAICNYHGALDVTDSTFTNNTATYDGGAIYHFQGTLDVTDSTFTNNTATGNGGAICNYHGTLDVTDSTFTNNTATRDGGAIYHFQGTLDVTDSTFTNNTTNYNGGAICNYYGTLDVTDSEFTDNTANYGGAIYNGGTLDVTDSTFTNNTATGNGGAIFNYGTLDVTDSTFTNNTATYDGGAIFNYGGDATSRIVNFNRIVGNNPAGSAIYSINGTVDARFNWWGSNSSPSGKVSTGTVLYDPWLILTVTASPDTIPSDSFSTVTADLQHDNHGNPVTGGHVPDDTPITFQPPTTGSYSSPVPTTLTNGQAQVTYSSEHAQRGNGVVTVTVDSENEQALSIDGFVENLQTHEVFNTIQAAIDDSDTQNGDELRLNQGTLHEHDISVWKDNLTISGSGSLQSIIDADNLGRIFYTGYGSGINLTLNNLILRNGNSGEASGGAIYDDNAWVTYSTLNITNCRFENNHADNNWGGAIYAFNVLLNINGSTFTGNTAAYNGGAIFNFGTLDVTDSEFTDNTANYGGAIYNGGSLTVNDSNFTDNGGTDTTFGGAIYNANNPATISNCIFDSNDADYGGAIYNQSELTIMGSYFTDNTADYGGAIYNDYSGDLTIDGVEFSGNIANMDGGAIYNNDALDISITEFDENSNNTGRGGAILNNGSMTIDECDFTGNSAHLSGGAIFNYGYCEVRNSNFSNNNTIINCGAAIFNNGTLIVNDSEFIDNSANLSGGAITNDNGDCTITGCVFNGNRSSYGGAVYNYYGDCTVNDSEFINNIAEIDGGAFGNRHGDATITGSYFEYNSATNGGAISSYYSTLTATTNTFKDNSAEIGGAIYNSQGNANVHFNRIIGNIPMGSEVYSEQGTLDATLNWWGSNSSPEDKISAGTEGTVLYDPWIILTVSANPTTINYGGTSEIQADLLHDSDNVYHDPAEGHVPDGILVTFTQDPVWGDISPVSAETSAGKVESVYSGNGALPLPADPVRVYAGADSEQNVYAEITIIKPTSTTAENANNYAGKKVNLTAHVYDINGNPVNRGTVQFTVNTATVTANAHNGLATCIWTIPSNWKSGTYTITARYLGTAYYNPSTGTARLTVNPSANLNFTKTISSGTHYYGNSIHYYLTVKNNGPDNATGVSVCDKLPYGLTYKKSRANIGQYKLSTSIWTIGTLKPGQTTKLDITAEINKVRTITNTATLTQSTYPQKPVKRSISFNVPAVITIPQLIEASGQIKTYYESYHKLPQQIIAAGQTLNMPQLLKLLTTATVNISKKNLKPINVTTVGKPSYPGGNYRPGKLYNYLSVAQNMRNFINKKGKAPNYVSTSLGNIPFSKLVYMYAKVLNFYGKQNRLPNWVATYKI